MGAVRPKNGAKTPKFEKSVIFWPVTPCILVVVMPRVRPDMSTWK
jgi:hypothetical protein